VKSCSYCGRNNEDAAHCCEECGTQFPVPTLGKSIELVTPSTEAAIGLPTIEMGFKVFEGFSRPDWKAIHTFIKSNVSQEHKAAVWQFIGEKWLLQLAKDLGGASRVYRSANLLCMSDLDMETVQPFLPFTESAMRTVRGYLGKAAWTGYFGRHVLLLFSEFDDYFRYISYYYPDGNHALSWGTLLQKGYVHMAIPYTNIGAVQNVIRHELVHNLLCYLPIPLWLNEGLAETIMEQAGNARFRLDQDLIDRHREYWNDTTIQDFWTGRSFHIPAEPGELSYSLASILVKLICEKERDLTKFITAANRLDAGQQAALDALQCRLVDIATEFLGPGNWAPRKEILDEYFGKRPA
jgi:hypothetical protein